MQIVAASKLDFSSTLQRCPHCGVGILPYGLHEPFVVDDAERVFCRQHGAEVEASYSAALIDYWASVRKRRLTAIEALVREAPDDAAAPSAE